VTPSQRPAHAAALAMQAMRPPCGRPSVTATHFPSCDGTSQASHWPEQRELQQRLSAQTPFWHCPSSVQAVPSGRAAVQADERQYGVDAAQSVLAPQLVRQAAPAGSHSRPPTQARVCTVGQAPAPSQAAASVSVLPAQLCGRQGVAVPGNAHAVREPAAHAPAHGPEPPHAARDP
jgi:hypothetical protein